MRGHAKGTVDKLRVTLHLTLLRAGPSSTFLSLPARCAATTTFFFFFFITLKPRVE